MKVIIAGSRKFEDYEYVKNKLDHYFKLAKPDEIICGCCEGVDQLGRRYGNENGIPIKFFPADWFTHGKAAGPIRNKAMAEYSNALILFWNGTSHGSRNMKYIATKLGLTIREVPIVEPQNLKP